MCTKWTKPEKCEEISKIGKVLPNKSLTAFFVYIASRATRDVNTKPDLYCILPLINGEIFRVSRQVPPQLSRASAREDLLESHHHPTLRLFLTRTH